MQLHHHKGIGMKTNSIFFLLVFVAIGVISVTWPISKERKFNNKFQLFLSSNKETVAIKELTDFSWDEVCLFKPYSINPNSFSIPNYTISSEIPNLMNDDRHAMLFKDSATHEAFFVNQGKITNEKKSNDCFSKNAKLKKIQHLGFNSAIIKE